MKELCYPFNSDYIIKNKRKIKKQLLELENLKDKKIAVLGGSTTNDIIQILELFLLNNGIKPVFYESNYNNVIKNKNDNSVIKEKEGYNYIKFTMYDLDNYYVISRVENTLIYVNASAQYKDEIESLLKKIDY